MVPVLAVRYVGLIPFLVLAGINVIPRQFFRTWKKEIVDIFIAIFPCIFPKILF